MTHPELPHNLEAEQAALGACLLNRDAITPIAPWLTADLFYRESHAWIYEAMLACYNRHEPPDIRTVSAELKRRNRLEQIGGVGALSRLVDSTPTSYHVEFYAREVERLGILRQIITAGGRIASIGYEADQEADEATSRALAELDRVLTRRSKASLIPFAAVADTLYGQMSAGGVVGVPTGFRDLDEITGGLQKTDLIILAARPSVGKSSLMLNLATNIAGAGTGTVPIFSLEMSKEQLMQRAACSKSGVDLLRTRQMRMREDEARLYLEALASLHDLSAFVDDTPAVSVSYIRNQALRHRAEHGPIAALFVDYLQLMREPGFKSRDNRVQEVSAISSGLKALAKELDVPVIALSQLSRAVEGRQSKVPMLSDLRESGSVEQDADVVMFIYREELYDQETDKKGVAELHIAKHRNGPVGIVPLRFEPWTTTFSDLTYRSPEGY
jgi:replicative DNA helicase